MLVIKYINYQELGRIAAQKAKQAVVQRSVKRKKVLYDSTAARRGTSPVLFSVMLKQYQH